MVKTKSRTKQKTEWQYGELFQGSFYFQIQGFVISTFYVLANFNAVSFYQDDSKSH